MVAEALKRGVADAIAYLEKNNDEADEEKKGNQAVDCKIWRNVKKSGTLKKIKHVKTQYRGGWKYDGNVFIAKYSVEMMWKALEEDLPWFVSKSILNCEFRLKKYDIEELLDAGH